MPYWQRAAILDRVTDIAERTTFGAPMSIAEDAWLSEAFALGAWPSRTLALAGVAAAIERDIAITNNRWKGATRSTSGEYVPGDVVRLRALTATWLLDLATADWQDSSGGEGQLPDKDRELAMIELLYASVPYFLPAAPALGVMASQPPDAALIRELHLPYPAVAVFFSAPFEIPPELRGGEEQLASRSVPSHTVRDVLVGEPPSSEDGPSHIRFATLAAYRGQLLSVVGVIVTADFDGTLSDLVSFVLADPIAKPTRFHIVEGRRRNSRLEPLVLNLAAAVAWGSWTPPDRGLELPDDARSPAFRDALRRGVFRRLEPRGAAAAVRVLDASKMAQRTRSETTTGTAHTSPATHLRRGHWQRYRIGPRGDWHYEPRWVPPVLVNPTGQPGRSVTVFRLPLPPDSTDG